MKWNRTEVSEWGCIVSGIVAAATAIIWFVEKMPGGLWFPILLMLAAGACAVLFYLGKRFDHREDSKEDDLDSFRNPVWETVSRRQFTNEQVDIDGKRFWDCTFKSVTLAFHGHAPAEFMGACTFSGNLRLMTDAPAAMHYSKLCQIFSKIPGLRAEFVSADESGNPLNPTFEIKELKGAAAEQTATLTESDPNIYIEFQDNRGPNVSPETQPRFMLVNRGTYRNAKTVCLERIRLKQHWIAFPHVASSVAPYTSADTYPRIEALDHKPADPEDFFDLLWKEYTSRHIPNLHELTLDLVATYQDDQRNLFETKCQLVFDPSAHEKTMHHSGQTGAIQVITLRNQKLRKIAVAI
jgi:hypothetical protein